MMKRLMLGVIRFYQLCLSGLLGPRCRFYPSCSEYTREAIEVHGPLRGARLGILRISKCHPFNPGGVDLVPSAEHPAEHPAKRPADKNSFLNNRS
jgi:uncharacterized protein